MTKEAKQLFKQRKRAIAQEKAHYNKFIFNGHFSLFLLILLGAFILGYGQWLQHMPQNINYALLASILFAVTTIFPIRTLLKDADRLFLLPFEKKMKAYMQQSIVYSYIQRIALQVILLVVIFPIFYKLHPGTYGYYIVFAVLAIVLPFFALVLKWQWLEAHFSIWGVQCLTFVMALASYYVTLELRTPYSLASIVAFAFLTWLLMRLNTKALYPWELMIQIEKIHHLNYYKFVNMFTDVKGVREVAVRRRYLDILLKTPKPQHFNESHMYLYLFKRSFVRGRDAFNIILRLVLIALVLMFWLHQPIISLVIGALFMYITLLQMAQFYTQQAYGLWPQVWPVAEDKVVRGYHQFLNRMMVIIGIIYSALYAYMFIENVYYVILFFIVGMLSIRNIVKKLKYQESLLRD